MLAQTLSDIPDVGRPVIDRTGLKGRFAFRLDYAVRANEERPDVFRAVQEQLGLRLVPSTAPVEVVVIDHLDKPTDQN